MAENNVKIELAFVDEAAQKALNDFINKTGGGDKALNKLKKSGESTFSAIGLAISKSSGLYDIFAGNLAANLATKAFETITHAASELFNVFVTEGIKAAQEQEDAINQLNQALAANGNFSHEASLGFQEFAVEMQKTSTVADEVILKNGALIESLTGLDTDGLKKATKAALDMSAALGIDLETASRNVAKAVNGNITGLQKLGITVSKSKDETVQLVNVVDALEGKFGGAAAAKTKTYSGAVEQLGNTFNDLQEEIGNLIVKNPAIIASFGEVSKILGEFTDNTKQNNGGLTQLVGEGFSGFIKAAAAGITALDALVRTGQVVYSVFQTMLLPVVGLESAFIALTQGSDAAAKHMNDFTKSANTNLNAFGDQGDGALATIATDLLRVGDAADAGLAKLKDGVSTSVDPVNNAAAAAAKLTEAQKTAGAAGAKLAENMIKSSNDTKAAIESQATAVENTSELTKTILKSQLDKQLIDYTTYVQQRDAIDASAQAVKEQLIQQQQDAQIASVKTALDQHLIDQTEFETAKSEIILKGNQLRQKSEVDFAKKSIQQRDADLKAEKDLQEKKVGAVADTFGNLKVLMQTSSKELFAIGKAAAIAESTINTYQAITKTMASVPYPFNVPLAIAQGIAGFVQVSNIAKTQPSFAGGGVVGGFVGARAGGDNTTVNARTGEMMLNAPQQRNLFDVANNGLNGSNVEGLLSRLIQSVDNQPITVSIGGRVIVETVRSELRAGRTFE